MQSSACDRHFFLAFIFFLLVRITTSGERKRIPQVPVRASRTTRVPCSLHCPYLCIYASERTRMLPDDGLNTIFFTNLISISISIFMCHLAAVTCSFGTVPRYAAYPASAPAPSSPSQLTSCLPACTQANGSSSVIHAVESAPGLRLRARPESSPFSLRTCWYLNPFGAKERSALCTSFPRAPAKQVGRV